MKILAITPLLLACTPAPLPDAVSACGMEMRLEESTSTATEAGFIASEKLYLAEMKRNTGCDTEKLCRDLAGYKLMWRDGYWAELGQQVSGTANVFWREIRLAYVPGRWGGVWSSSSYTHEMSHVSQWHCRGELDYFHDDWPDGGWDATNWNASYQIHDAGY